MKRILIALLGAQIAFAAITKVQAANKYCIAAGTVVCCAIIMASLESEDISHTPEHRDLARINAAKANLAVLDACGTVVRKSCEKTDGLYAFTVKSRKCTDANRACKKAIEAARYARQQQKLAEEASKAEQRTANKNGKVKRK